MDRAWLVSQLANSLSADSASRVSAEAALRQSSTTAGFGPSLLAIAADASIDAGTRQLAAVLVKQLVEKHWQAEEEDAEEEGDNEGQFTLPGQEKASIRQLLLPSLDAAAGERKIRTSLAVAIAHVAARDWPQEWPDLMEQLLRALGDAGSPGRVSAAVQCLELFAEEIDDSQLPALVPRLLPSLLAVVANTQAYDGAIRASAVTAVHAVLCTLGVMTGVYKKETTELIAHAVPAWLQQFCAILSSPIPPTAPSDWELRKEVLRCLKQLMFNFPSLVEAAMPTILAALWQNYVSGIPIYEHVVVCGQPGKTFPQPGTAGAELQPPRAEETDLTEEEVQESLSALAIQAFEFLLTLTSSARFNKALEGTSEALVYFAIAYTQITAAQEGDWSRDPNEFVSEEDDELLSCRTSAASLLEEQVAEFGSAAVKGISLAVQRRLGDSLGQHAAGVPHWWKLREAAIFAAGTVADAFVRHEMQGEPVFDCKAFLDALLSQDLSPGGASSLPFLYSRCLWAAARYSSIASPESKAQLLQVAAEALSSDRHMVVRIGACRCLARVLPQAQQEERRKVLAAVYRGVSDMLPEVSEDSLHLVLDLLTAAIRADPQAAAEMEPAVAAALLSLWASHVNDPVISSDASDALEAIAELPQCISPLLHKATPQLAAILSQPEQEQTEGLVAGAMELMTMLLKHTPSSLLRPVFDALFPPLVAVVLKSEDHTELQNGAEALAMMVRKGGEDLAAGSSDPEGVTKALLDATARLLSPQLEPSASLFVGPLLSQLVRRMPAQTAPILRPLVAAIVARMAAKRMPSLSISLLLVIARLIHWAGSDTSSLIDLLSSIPVDGHPNALHFVLNEWAMFHRDIHGEFCSKLATTALARLVATADPRLQQVSVQGRLVSSSSKGPVTRSRSRVVADKWTEVPFPAKALSLLAAAMKEERKREQQREAMGGGKGKGRAGMDEEDDDEDDNEAIDEDGDGEDDDDEDGNDVEGVKASLVASGSAFASAELFAHVLDQAIGDDVFVDDDEEEDDADDPLNELSTTAVATQAIRQLAAADPQAFQTHLKDLTAQENATIRVALEPTTS